jgi:hypothetical protein
MAMNLHLSVEDFDPTVREGMAKGIPEHGPNNGRNRQNHHQNDEEEDQKEQINNAHGSALQPWENVLLMDERCPSSPGYHKQILKQ